MSTLRQRFEGKYIPEPNSGCWLWLASHLKDRYGAPSYGVIGVGSSRTMLAHRASWLLAHGAEPPAGQVLMHKCDTRLCVNPGHLSLGTHAENNADMAAKGRACRGERRASITRRSMANPDFYRNYLAARPRGETHSRAKLSDADVAAIRASAETDRVLATRFPVTVGHIKRVRRGAAR